MQHLRYLSTFLLKSQLLLQESSGLTNPFFPVELENSLAIFDYSDAIVAAWLHALDIGNTSALHRFDFTIILSLLFDAGRKQLKPGHINKSVLIAQTENERNNRTPRSVSKNFLCCSLQPAKSQV